MALQQTRASFQTTQWPLLDEVRASDPAGRAQAIAVLVQRYWPPVYATLRRDGRTPDAAAELTQAFFADVVLGRGLFDTARAERGRLRTLMLTALKRYVIDQHRRGRTRAEDRLIPFEAALAQEESILASVADLAPEDAFQRRWALMHLQEALNRCERHFRDGGREAHWLIFEDRVLRPAISTAASRPLADLAAAHGFRSSADAAAAVQVVKKRLLTLLREVISEQTTDPGEQEDEFQAVLSLGR